MLCPDLEESWQRASSLLPSGPTCTRLPDGLASGDLFAVYVTMKTFLRLPRYRILLVWEPTSNIFDGLSIHQNTGKPHFDGVRISLVRVEPTRRSFAQSLPAFVVRTSFVRS